MAVTAKGASVTVSAPVSLVFPGKETHSPGHQADVAESICVPWMVRFGPFHVQGFCASPSLSPAQTLRPRPPGPQFWKGVGCALPHSRQPRPQTRGPDPDVQCCVLPLLPHQNEGACPHSRPLALSLCSSPQIPRAR